MGKKIETICVQDLFYYIDIILISYLLYMSLIFLKKKKVSQSLYRGYCNSLLKQNSGFFFKMFAKCFDYFKQRTF